MRYSSLGPNEFSEMRLVPEFQVVDYDYADVLANGTLLIPINAGTLVLSVAHETLTTFGPGGSTLAVGDSANATNWLAAADITSTSAHFVRSNTAGETNATGKKYATVDYIKLTFFQKPSTGTGRVYIETLPSVAAEDRVPAVGNQDYASPTYPTTRP